MISRRLSFVQRQIPALERLSACLALRSRHAPEIQIQRVVGSITEGAVPAAPLNSRTLVHHLWMELLCRFNRPY